MTALRTVLLSSLFSLAACSSDPASTVTKPVGNSPSDSGVSDTDEDAAPPPQPCAEPGPSGAQCVKTISGKVVDETGAPVGDKLVSVCGQVCFFGKTTADGTFTTKIGQNIKLANFAASVHGRPDYASLYEKIPATSAEEIVLEDALVLPKLAATGTKIPMNDKRVVTAAVEVTDGDVTLGFEADTELDLDLEDISLVTDGGPGDQLRVVKIAEAHYPTFVKGQNVKLLYAANPFDLKFVNKKVALTIKNNGAFPANSEVEIIGLGNEFLAAPFTAGTLEVVAKGTVSADGARIVTDAGAGLTTLTWIGVRAK